MTEPSSDTFHADPAFGILRVGHHEFQVNKIWRYGAHVEVGGWTVSLQWDVFHYGSNKNKEEEDASRAVQAVEVKVWDSVGRQEYHFEDGDSVSGWMSVEKVLALFDELEAGSPDSITGMCWMRRGRNA